MSDLNPVFEKSTQQLLDNALLNAISALQYLEASQISLSKLPKADHSGKSYTLKDAITSVLTFIDYFSYGSPMRSNEKE